MDLIERYVYAVLHYLPPHRRQEAGQDLRARIDEAVRKKTGGQPAARADIEAVLQELGNPRAMADHYRGEARYLIGPALFEPYWLMLRIVLIAVAIGIVLSFIVQVIADPAHANWQWVANFISGLYGALMSAFGLVTIIFALIQYYSPHAADSLKARLDQWKPSALPPVPAVKLDLKKGESVATIIFSCFALLLANIAIWAVGLYVVSPSGTEITPLFSERFSVLLPLIDISLAVVILIEIGKLIMRHWNWWLILASMAQKIFALVVGLRLFSDPAIFNPAFFSRLDDLLGYGQNLPANLPSTIARILTILVIFGFVVDILTLLAKGVRLIREQAVR
jgi:hypothetical protein